MLVEYEKNKEKKLKEKKLRRELYVKKVLGDEETYKKKIRSKKMFFGEFYDPKLHFDVDFDSD